MIPPKRNTNTGTFAARKTINASFEASPGCVPASLVFVS